MKIFNRATISENQQSLPMALGIKGTGNIKSDFVSALNSFQGVRMQYSNSPKFTFDDKDMIAGLYRAHVLEQVIPVNNFIYTNDEKKRIEEKTKEGIDILRGLNPILVMLFDELINQLTFINSDLLEGGSATCYVGFIWLAPKETWTGMYYGELLLHEFVHNSLFLEDMIGNIFPNPKELMSRDAMATSAILRYKRNFDKSYHSALVSSALVYYYAKLGLEKKADSFVLPALKTIRELKNNYLKLKDKGRQILTQNGFDILLSAEKLLQTRDTDIIDNELQKL